MPSKDELKNMDFTTAYECAHESLLDGSWQAAQCSGLSSKSDGGSSGGGNDDDAPPPPPAPPAPMPMPMIESSNDERRLEMER